MRLLCGVGDHGWFKGPGPKISACGIGKRAAGIADGDHGQFVARAGCASGWCGEGDDPDPWVRPGSEGGGDAGDRAVRARWRAGPWRACLGRSGKRLAGPSTVWERAARGGGNVGRAVSLGWVRSGLSFLFWVWAGSSYFLFLYTLSFQF